MARRKVRLLVAVAIVLIVPSVAMVIVNRIETEVPPPVWTLAAFPIPAEAENGWPSIRHYDSMTISGIDLEPIDKLLSLARQGKSPAELARFFSPARVVASKITEHTKICSESFARERMVVPCLSLDKHECSTEPLAICSRLLGFAALDEAARGSPHGARRIEDVLRQLSDAAASSPHPWVQARTLVLLPKAIHHAVVVAQWHRASGPALRKAIAAIDEVRLPEKHLVIASYLLKHLALREALARTDTWLLDEGDIMRGFNAPFQEAEDGRDLPPPTSYEEGLFWWFKNPVGKRMLEKLAPGADEDFLKSKGLRDKVLAKRDEALKLNTL